MEEFGIRYQLIPDISREFSVEQIDGLVESLAPFLGKGVVGLGLGGQEIGNPPEKFETIYRQAKVLGFRLHAHAVSNTQIFKWILITDEYYREKHVDLNQFEVRWFHYRRKYVFWK